MGCCSVEIYKPTGRSMYPFIRENSILVVKKVSADFLCIGDLIVFRAAQHQVVHRIIKKVKTIDGMALFQTKGDANRFLDSPVSYEDIVGKVYIIQKNDSLKLLFLDSWRMKIVNYFLAKINHFKVKMFCFSKYFRSGLRMLILYLKGLL